MMRWPMTVVLLGVALLLAGCEGRVREPYFSAVQPPPVAASLARLYFYRDFEPYESLAEPWISLNGQATTLSVPGGISYRDVPPGQYHITVLSPGLYPNQFKTVLLRPGETYYVKIESLASWDEDQRWAHDTFVVALIGEEQARVEIGGMRLVSGNP